MRLTSLTSLAIVAALAVGAGQASAQDAVGVASCDAFLKTYSSCVLSKVPEGARAEASKTLDQTRSNWKAVASTADGKAKLDQVCKDTTEKVKKEVAGLNCAW